MFFRSMTSKPQHADPISIDTVREWSAQPRPMRAPLPLLDADRDDLRRGWRLRAIVLTLTAFAAPLLIAGLMAMTGPEGQATDPIALLSAPLATSDAVPPAIEIIAAEPVDHGTPEDETEPGDFASPQAEAAPEPLAVTPGKADAKAGAKLLPLRLDLSPTALTRLIASGTTRLVVRTIDGGRFVLDAGPAMAPVLEGRFRPIGALPEHMGQRELVLDPVRWPDITRAAGVTLRRTEGARIIDEVALHFPPETDADMIAAQRAAEKAHADWISAARAQGRDVAVSGCWAGPAFTITAIGDGLDARRLTPVDTCN